MVIDFSRYISQFLSPSMDRPNPSGCAEDSRLSPAPSRWTCGFSHALTLRSKLQLLGGFRRLHPQDHPGWSHTGPSEAVCDQKTNSDSDDAHSYEYVSGFVRSGGRQLPRAIAVCKRLGQGWHRHTENDRFCREPPLEAPRLATMRADGCPKVPSLPAADCERDGQFRQRRARRGRTG